MSTPGLRLYLDEDSLTRPVVRQLRQFGFDVATVEQEDRRGLSDDEQLAFAAEHARVMFTKNIRDYRRLHNAYMLTGQHHSGIILLGRPYYDVGSQIRGIRNLDAALTPEEMVDRVEFLANWVQATRP